MNTKQLNMATLLAIWLPAAVLFALAAALTGLAAGHPALGPQESITLYAVTDATVRSIAPNTNFGSEHTLEISYSSDVVAEEVVLVRFDLSSLPANAIIDLAVMELYLVGAAGDNPKFIAAYYITGAWDENTVTWNTFPTADPTGIVAAVDNVMGAYKSWTVTSWASYWQSRPSENHGVYLRRIASETAYFERVFESREHNEHLPRLVVRYHLPATATPTATLPPGCPDLIANGGFETGDLPPWSLAGPGGVSGPGRNSERAAWLAGSDNVASELLQGVAIPAGAAPVRLAFWWRADAASEQPADVLSVLVQHGGQADNLRELSATAPLGQWRYEEVDLSAYAGRQIAVTFLAHTDGEVPSTFRLDDVSLGACETSTRLLAAQRDTYVAAYDGDRNFGAEPVLRTQWHADVNDEAIALLWFDTSDMLTQTEVIAAYLSLVLTGTQASNLTIVSVHEVTEPWEEMAVTWQTRPSYAAEPVTSAEVITTTERHTFWDITPLVRMWVSNPASNHGLALRVQHEGGGSSRTFGSRESNAIPQLVLSYTLPPIEWPEPTPTPLPPHLEVTLPISDTAYLRWDGYESYDRVRVDPGPIVLSYDARQPVIEARLLSFDVSTLPTTTLVYQARLELFLEGGTNAEPVLVTARMMDVLWTGQTATWGATFYYANEEYDAPSGNALTVLGEPHWISLNVTRIVQKWVSHGGPNLGFLLRGPDSLDQPWSRQFAGGATGEHAPRLVILYAPQSMAGTVNSTENMLAGQSPLGPPSVHLLCPLGPAQPYTWPGARRNWAVIDRMVMITGTVSGASVSHHEEPSSHNGHDFCFHLKKNPANAWAMGSYNPNDIEVEWDQMDWGNQVWPLWAWPSNGDDAIVFGPWVFDCGHGSNWWEGGKTEIHAPHGVVAIRKQVAADVSAHGGLGTVLLNRADIFFSNRRTRAFGGGFWDPPSPYPPFVSWPLWVPFNDNPPSLSNQNYEFDLYPPENAAANATLVWWTEDRTGENGVRVTPQVTQVGSGTNAYLHVVLPFQGKSGALYTASAIYYGWTRTFPDPDLRAFKVTLHGVNITDNTESVLLGPGEWYLWLNVNDRWFNLRDYVSGLAHAKKNYYSTDKKALEAHVIVPNSSDGKIRVRANGYESDCFDDLYGWDFPWPVYHAAKASCVGWDNDEIQGFNEEFDKTKGFGVGRQTYYPTEDKDGKYGLDISIVEEDAPLQIRTMRAAVAGSAMTVDGACGLDEYEDSQEIQFGLNGGSVGSVKARAAYDQDALYVCLDDVPASPFDSESQWAVIYLDPGNPSKPKLGTTWIGRNDDLRIVFQTKPTKKVTAYFFDPTVGRYAKLVPAGLVTADRWVDGVLMSIEFRIDKSLIPRGPWSKTVTEENLINQGIGTMIAIEIPTEARSGAWPLAAYPTDPRAWGRMLFEPGCPVTLEFKRLSPLWGESVGQTGLLQVHYRVFDHPRCDFVTGSLTIDVDEEYWTPVPRCDLLSGWCGIPGGGTYQNGVIRWTLPSAPKEGTATFTVHQERRCSEWVSGLWAELYATFANVPPADESAGVNMCPPPEQLPPGSFPDLTVRWKGWPLPPRPPWFKILDPVRLGDPPELLFSLRNDDIFARRVMVKAIPVPEGVSNADLAANQALDFSNATTVNWYTIPANTTISVHRSLNLPLTQAAQAAHDDAGAVAVEVSQPDGGMAPQVSILQRVVYLQLTPGHDNVFSTTVWHTVREPADLHLQVVAHCPGWAATVEPDTLPAQGPGTSATVQVHLRPPEGTLLGSGCPVDLIAWSDLGEFAGSQRFLDLPPVQASPDQPPFASSEIELEPAQPRVGEQVRACVIVRNRANTPLQAEVLLGMSDRLSTAPYITRFATLTVEVPAAGLARACSDPFDWTGDRSFQAIVRQAGYRDQTIRRHVALAPMSDGGALQPILLEVRNPLTTTAVLSLTHTLVGLPGWGVEMPAAVTLGPGEAANVNVQLIRPQAGTQGANALPGDEGRVEIWTHTADGRIVGGAWLQVWQQASEIFLPLILKR